MKYLIILLSIATTALADSYEVYEYSEYGTREMFPSHSVEVEEDTVRIYKHNKYGARDWAPSVEIQKQPSADDLYKKYYPNIEEVFKEPSPSPQPNQYLYGHPLDY